MSLACSFSWIFCDLCRFTGVTNSIIYSVLEIGTHKIKYYALANPCLINQAVNFA